MRSVRLEVGAGRAEASRPPCSRATSMGLNGDVGGMWPNHFRGRIANGRLTLLPHRTPLFGVFSAPKQF